MTLVSYLTGLFRGHSADGELEAVRDAARQDAQLMVGTYVQEFEAEAAKIFTSRQRHFLGLQKEEEEEEPDSEATEAVVYDKDKLARYGKWARPRLVKAANKAGVSGVRDMTKGNLVYALAEVK